MFCAGLGNGFKKGHHWDSVTVNLTQLAHEPCQQRSTSIGDDLQYVSIYMELDRQRKADNMKARRQSVHKPLPRPRWDHSKVVDKVARVANANA